LRTTRKRNIVRDEESVAIELDGQSIPYVLKRSSARHTLALRVQDNGRVWVNAPFHIPRQQIELFIRSHAQWLRGRLERHRIPFQWQNGMALPYLGRELHVCLMPLAKVHPQLDLFGLPEDPPEPEVVFAGDVLLCSVAVDDLARVVADWYRRQAHAILDEHLRAVCRHLGMPLPTWHLSDAHSRWGSLSPKGLVSLNWRLIKASPAEIDYVICHELAHFRQRNHSPAFWREVARLYPDFETARARLRQNGRRYFEF
jgi:hypothetical protein